MTAGSQVFSLHRNRLTIFDVRNPAAPAQVGQYVSQLGDPLDHLILGASNFVYLLSDHNTLLTIDISTPTTPTLTGLMDFPDSTVVGVRANDALYLFGARSLIIVDVAKPALPALVRSLPVTAPTAAAAWANALYLVESDGMQVLDIADAANPIPGVRVAPPQGMHFASLGPAQGGRIALHVLPAPGGGVDASQRHVAVYDLSNPLAPRLAAVAPGNFEDAWFDGARMLLPGAEVVAIGPGTRFTAPLATGSFDQTVILPGGNLPPGLTFTYSTQAKPASATVASSTSESRACLQHDQDPARLSLPLLGQAAYAGPFMLQIVDCQTGLTYATAIPVTVTLNLPAALSAPYNWSLAEPFLDESSRWTFIPGAQQQDTVWSATLTPPVTWGVRGPVPNPILLPWVVR